MLYFCLFLLQRGMQKQETNWSFFPKYVKLSWDGAECTNKMMKQHKENVSKTLLTTGCFAQIYKITNLRAWFCCAALACPFSGATAKVGLTGPHSTADFPCQNVLVCVFSVLSKDLFLSYLLSTWDNSSKDKDKCGASATHSVASSCEVNIGHVLGQVFVQW